MRVRVLPYKRGSAGAKALAQALEVPRLRVTGSRFTPRDNDVVINWGSSTRSPKLAGIDLLNNPEQVSVAANKLSFFRHMEFAAPHLIPDFWDNPADIPDSAFPVFCRTDLKGHSGRGIVIANTRDELVEAPLYVKQEKIDQEFRLHVAGGEVIDYQRKARKLAVPTEKVNWSIRNHSNGFVFVRGGVTVNDKMKHAAVTAVAAAGLDFGAVDLIQTKDARAVVLEVNTAPGLEGQTLTSYTNYFQEVINA